MKLLCVLLLPVVCLAQTAPTSTPTAPTPVAADSVATIAADTLAVATVDSLPAPRMTPEVRDFFDTGVDATAVVLMTPVFPGWGQLYVRGGWRAALAFGAQWWFLSNMISRDRDGVRFRDHAKTLPRDESARVFWDGLADESFEQYRDWAWWSSSIMLLVAFDAYVGAGLYRFDEEPLPVPTRFDEYFPDSTPHPIGSRGAPVQVIGQWGWRF